MRRTKFMNHEAIDNPAVVGASMAKSFAILACTSLLFGFAYGAAAAESVPKGPQGRTYDSLKQLPDWSGTWAMDIESHLRAGAEGRETTETGKKVPLTPKYWELRHQATIVKQAQQPLSYCLPAGVPGVMLHTIQYEFLFTPGQITMLTENGEIRRFYTDGRKHRPLSEMAGSYEGDSIAHWEGNTLVVDTIGFPKGTLFQNGDVTATKNTHYVERIFLKDKDHMQIDSVMDDPAIFTKPYAFTRMYERLGPSFPMQEPQCAQSNHLLVTPEGDKLDLTPPEE